MMSDEYDVHGPHDHAIDHVVQHGHVDRDPFASRIAVTTAVLATLGALCSYQAGSAQTDAQLFRNNAAVRTNEASELWNAYQASNARLGAAELGVALASATQVERFKADAQRYRNEVAEIGPKARMLAAEASTWDDKAGTALRSHHRWAQATMVLQIAIALAAIALLTRRGWLQWAMAAVAAAGAVMGVLTALGI